MSCPSCGRPVAVARPSCLYCGAALPQEAVARAEQQTREVLAGPAGAFAAPAEGLAGAERALLVLDFDGVEPAAAGELLALSAYEAGQRVRGGGLQLHRVLSAPDGAAEAARLQAAGLRAWAIPEGELRAAPARQVLGGTRAGERLQLRTEDGEIALAAEAIRLVVKGPIARDRPPQAEIRRLRLAVPEGGYRIHFHPVDDARPLELDPEDFDFGPTGPESGSSMLELNAWVDALARTVPVDDRFRRLPPAFGPAAPDRRALRGALAGGPAKAEVVLLDNLAQFRTYSGWRGAVERRRALPSARP